LLNGVRVLLLQGPVGGFFSYLARDLTGRGHTVARFCFNGGDLLYSSRFRPINYTGGQKGWRAWLRNFCGNWKPDVILFFGDQRPIHRIAMQVAQERGIEVYAFEEGYIRPSYVTFEKGGNNARSPLLRNGMKFADVKEPPDPPELRPQFGAMSWRAIGYYLAKAGGTVLYPGYLHHRRRTVPSEIYQWVRSWVRLLRTKKRDGLLIDRLRSPNAPPFFLVAFQVHDDLQLLRHGKGWRNRTLGKAILDSFAANAGPEDLLVFKVHPMDRGHRHYEARVLDDASRLGISDRVRVLQSGPLAPVVRAAKGLITINSSSGIAAIDAGIPVLAFGKAIYGIPGLAKGEATIADLDAFWRNPLPPDEDLARRVVAILKLDHMLPGSFYLQETWREMCERIDARLRQDLAGESEHREPELALDEP
jgi:capsular polysaccharide export protein